MNGADKEKEEAIAHIRRSTAIPIQRFLDAVLEHPSSLENPPSSEGEPAWATLEGARRPRLGGRWRPASRMRLARDRSAPGKAPDDRTGAGGRFRRIGAGTPPIAGSLRNPAGMPSPPTAAGESPAAVSFVTGWIHYQDLAPIVGTRLRRSWTKGSALPLPSPDCRLGARDRSRRGRTSAGPAAGVPLHADRPRRTPRHLVIRARETAMIDHQRKTPRCAGIMIAGVLVASVRHRLVGHEQPRPRGDLRHRPKGDAGRSQRRPAVLAAANSYQALHGQLPHRDAGDPRPSCSSSAVWWP